MYRVRFTPEVLGMVASSGLFALGVEVLLLKFGFYMASPVSPISILEAVALSGYKFVRLDFGGWAWWA